MSTSMKFSFLNYTDKDVCSAIFCIEAMGHLVFCLLIIFYFYFLFFAVPLHAMEALGGRGGIAPTHSRPRH
jgi:hypothetical protein